MDRFTETVGTAKLGLNNWGTRSKRAKFLLESENLWAAVSPDAEGVKTRRSSSDNSDKSDHALGPIGLLVEDSLLRESTRQKAIMRCGRRLTQARPVWCTTEFTLA